MPELFFCTTGQFFQLMNQHGPPYDICQNSISHSVGVHHTEYDLYTVNKG